MAKKMSSSLEKKQMRYGYIFILPLIIGLVIVFIPNIINTIIFTLNNINIDSGGYKLEFVGIDNYMRAMTDDPQYILKLINSLKQIATDIPVVVIFSLFVAVILNQKFRGRVFARTAFFIPVLLSTGVIAKIEQTSNLIGKMDAGRVINTGTSIDIAQMAGIRNLLLSVNLNATLIGIVVSAADGIYKIVQSSGIQIFIILAGLQEIPASLYEAAKVEGCDGWQLFWKITFPMISPQLVICSIYTIVDSFTKPNSALFEYINSVAFGQNQYGYATAMSFIYFLGIGLIIAVFGAVISKFVFYND